MQYPELLVVPIIAAIGLLLMFWGDRPGQKRVMYTMLASLLFCTAIFLALKAFSNYTRSAVIRIQPR
jgi:hypothetical protein